MYNFEPTRFPELFRLEIADQVYLISKEGVSVRTETICHKQFEREKMIAEIELEREKSQVNFHV